MSSFMSAADALKLNGRLHINRLWLAELDLPSGWAYLHSGVGSFTYGGHDYIGVSDPVSARFVSVGQIDEPQFGQAAAVQITLNGAGSTFLKSVHDVRAQIEGRAAKLYWALFDAETQTLETALLPVFPFGRMTKPIFQAAGLSVRTITLTIESIWQAKNFPPGGRWNPAGQHARYPGDLGLDYVGVEITDYWQ